jgi:hypothetical protein
VLPERETLLPRAWWVNRARKHSTGNRMGAKGHAAHQAVAHASVSVPRYSGLRVRAYGPCRGEHFVFAQPARAQMRIHNPSNDTTAPSRQAPVQHFRLAPAPTDPEERQPTDSRKTHTISWRKNRLLATALSFFLLLLIETRLRSFPCAVLGLSLCPVWVFVLCRRFTDGGDFHCSKFTCSCRRRAASRST